MILFIQLLFWITVLLILHTYVFFPLILKLVAGRKAPNRVTYAKNDAELPEIAVIMAVHNEQEVIAKKIEIVFDSDYPADKIHFYIGSDKSGDDTNAIIRKHESRYQNLRLIEFTERTGKAGIINHLVERVQQEILILTDANVLFDRETIYALVKHYKNPDIALVGGNILNQEYRREGISYQEKKYLERENIIKYREGLIWGTMMGAFGGLYSIRKSFFAPVPRNFLVDDFYITMHALAKGKLAINELSAVSYEDASNKISEEFRRKVRISAGNFQNLSVYKKLLWPPFTGLAFSFLSHKVLRWITPFLLIINLFCNALLLNYHAIYRFALAAQIMCLCVPLMDALLKKIAINFRVFRFISHFYSMNLALLIGFIKYSIGVKTNIWRPTERNQ